MLKTELPSQFFDRLTRAVRVHGKNIRSNDGGHISIVAESAVQDRVSRVASQQVALEIVVRAWIGTEDVSNPLDATKCVSRLLSVC